MKIEKSECNYQVTECDLKFGKQITLDGEVLIPMSVLDKIRAEIEAYQSDAFYHDNVMMNKRMVLEIIDKYRKESEETQ